MSDGYFVIMCTADGLVFDGPLTADELSLRLDDEDYYGVDEKKFVKEVPDVDGFCLSMEEDELLIIKGSVVQPKPKKVVSKWTVE